ncbi:MAG: excinuclease ABC subunit C [Candidatus Omnitrophica bacterium CG12_big_fil_rev_8_21_14_0_65_43_15]|uniref:Excinuclease ABC subunit C n=1 Tax=Candidatus Taenaricola geysiri TaxID=1974752 RepID=A0A2J0LE06_9BACT|nr:MAG: excinuclease ABC subunit C [Candidatus Omnitrophica bacterium CG12_big_fil_rev_8_21_14_0_65_43_15]
MDIKKKIKTLPLSPGVYLMKNKSGEIIYIGKAASLRKRVSSYFDGKRRQAPKKAPGAFCKTDVLVSSIADIDYFTTPSEEEALLLEAALIREKKPRYNVLLKDDKRYPLLKLTLNEEFPRLIIARRAKDDGAIYFGPYTNAKLLRKALGIMRKMFPLRTCKVIHKSACLNYHIKQCAGPCVDKKCRGLYKQVTGDLILFLSGKKKKLISKLTQRMNAASKSCDFEAAARLRDQLKALTSAVKERKQARIEAFDISNISGKEAVGSMVSFYNGKPDKSNYRKYRIKTVSGVDDYGMIKEVITRRYKKLVSENLPLPDLIVIDGGIGHVSAAAAVLDALGLNRINILGIAKKEERIFSRAGEERIGEEFRRLIQHARDEAHRFAQSYHHVLRRKKVIGE